MMNNMARLRRHFLLLGSSAISLTIPLPAYAQEADTSKRNQRTNADVGREETIATLSVPVLVDQKRSSNALAQITTKRIIALSADDLRRAVESRLNEKAVIALQELGDGLIPLEQLLATGLIIKFNPQALAVEIEIPIELRGRQISGGNDQSYYDGLPAVRPSKFAFGLTGSLFTGGDLTNSNDRFTTLNLSGFANVGGAEGVNLVYGGDITLQGDEDFFRRDRVVAFKDDLDNVLRYSVGDLIPLQPRLSGSFDVLGISLERSYNDLQPTRNIRPIGRSSFLLERRSRVEVYVNGALLRSFDADPGPIDIRDIPSVDVSNNVSIIVEDALGRREIDSFAIGNDFNLLDKGLSEFSFSAGLLRDGTNGNGISYSNDPIASAFYSVGLSETLTVGGHAVASEDHQNIGGTAAFSIPGGVIQSDATVSRSSVNGFGAAVAFTYRGDPFGLADQNGQLNVRADYRTRNFSEVSSFNLRDTIKLDAAADFRMDLSNRVSASVGGSFVSRYGLGDTYSAFAGLQRQFGRFSAGVTGRYSRRSDGRTDVGALLTFSLPLGRRGTAFASVDTTTERARFEYRKRRSLEFPQIEYSGRLEYGPRDYEAGADVRFANSRFAAEADLTQTYERDTKNWRTNGTLRLQSGIGFVDGRIGIGRDPSRGFVMVRRHESLRPASVDISTGSAGRDLGQANKLGPALIPIETAHRSTTLRLGTNNAPIGYNIGAGEYAIFPGAASGLSIQVGSEAYRIVIVFLTAENGEVVSLKTGRLSSADGKVTETFFTNRNGRAVINGLAPGEYTLTIDETQQRYSFMVSENAETLIKLGTVQLEKAE